MRSTLAFPPSTRLSEFIASVTYRCDRLGGRTFVRPITASPEVLLVFHLDGPSEAFEYLTGRTRVLPPALVVGPQTGRRAELFARGDRASLVVRFRPGGFHRLFHVPTEQLVDAARDASDIIGADAGQLCANLAARRSLNARLALLESFLDSRVASARPRHATVDAASAILESHGTRRVCDVVRASGLSARQFERAFREQMGLSPKLFARAARLDFAIGLKRGNPDHTWTRVSQEAGYFDQTHFVKDFKALAGETPSTFPLSERPVTLQAARRPA